MCFSSFFITVAPAFYIRNRNLDMEKPDTSIRSKHSGKKTKSPTHAVKTSKSRSHRNPMKLFNFLKPKRSKVSNQKERHVPSTSSIRDNVSSQKRKVFAPVQKTSRVSTESEKETPASDGESNQLPIPSCSRPTAVVGPMQAPENPELSQHESQDSLTLENSHAGADNSVTGLDLGGVRAANHENECRDNIIFEESYFEDAYLPSNNQYEEETINLHNHILFSTPVSIGFHRSRPHVHMGVSSLVSSGTNKTLQTEKAASASLESLETNPILSNQCLSLTNDLITVNDVSSSLGDTPTSKTVSESEAIMDKQVYTDKEIASLPALHPTVSHKFTFDTSAEYSISFAEDMASDDAHKDVEILGDTGQSQLKTENVAEIALMQNEKRPSPKYESKKPKDLTIESRSTSSTRLDATCEAENKASCVASQTIASPTKKEGTVSKCKSVGYNFGFKNDPNINSSCNASDKTPSCFYLPKNESGYDTCGKTPISKSPCTSDENTFSFSTITSTTSLSPTAATWSSESAVVVTQVSPYSANLLTTIDKDKESTSNPSRPSETDGTGDFNETNTAKSAKFTGEERLSEGNFILKKKASPVKRSLNFNSENTYAKTERVEQTKNAQVISHSFDIGNNNRHTNFNLNESLIDQTEDSVPSSQMVPIPICTSSPRPTTKTNCIIREDSSHVLPSINAGSKRPFPANSSEENGQKHVSKKHCDKKFEKIDDTESSQSEDYASTEPNQIKKESEKPKRLVKKKSKNSPTCKRCRVRFVQCECEEDSEDENSIAMQNSRLKEYEILKNAAEIVLMRIPAGCCKREKEDTMRIMKFINDTSRQYMAPKSKGSTPVNGKLKISKSSGSLPRNLRELKKKIQHSIDLSSFKVTEETFMDDLIHALLSGRKEAVDQCCDFAFRNIQRLETIPSFKDCPSEIILMILCHRDFLILGENGFPLSYTRGEWEVLRVAYQYYKYWQSQHTQAKPRPEKVFYAVDQKIWTKCLKELNDQKERLKEDDKRTVIRLLSMPETFRTPCRDYFTIKFKESKIYAPQPAIYDTRENEIKATEQKTEKFHRGQQFNFKIEPQSMNLSASPSKSRIRRWRNGQKILDNRIGLHTLRQIDCFVLSRKGKAYITGLQFGLHYSVFKTVGDCEKNKVESERAQGESDRNATSDIKHCPTVEFDQVLSKKHSAVEHGPDGGTEVATARPPHEDTSGECTKEGSDPREPMDKLGQWKVSFILDAGEHITDAKLKCTSVLHNLQFTTNKGRSFTVHSCDEMDEWTTVEQPSASNQPSRMSRSCESKCSLHAIHADTLIPESSTPVEALCNVQFVWTFVGEPQPCQHGHDTRF